MKTLLITDGVVTGAVTSPGGLVQVTPAEGSTPLNVADDHPAAIGWLCPDGTEATLEYALPRRLVLTPMEFINLFPVPAENAIRASADPIVVGFLRRVDHPALKSIDLRQEGNRNGVLYLAATGLVTAEEAATVLAGVVDAP